MIVGIGTSICETLRIGRLIERYGERFLFKVYSADEVIHCRGRVEYLQNYTARWAGKEAVVRALGTRFIRDANWRDVEVVTTKTGHTLAELHGPLRDIAREQGVTRIHLSMAYTRAYATATAIAEGMAGDNPKIISPLFGS